MVSLAAMPGMNDVSLLGWGVPAVEEEDGVVLSVTSSVRGVVLD